MADLPKLENALTALVSQGELQDFAAESFGSATGVILKGESVGEIPGVGLIRAIIRDGAAIRDHIFEKKLFAFLGSLNSIPKNEREAMVGKLERDPKYGRNVGEHLIEVLDRIESHRKPQMLARVFRAYGAGDIDAVMFHQLVHVIENLPAFAIPAVRKFGETYPPNRGADATIQLYFGMAGLAVPQTTWDAQTYDPTPVAEAFLRLELDRQE